jgi:hypothetical protein
MKKLRFPGLAGFLAMAFYAVTCGPAAAQVVYSESGGTVSMEAERGTSISHSGVQWSSSASSWGYSGSGFLLPSPSYGTYFGANYIGVAPQVDFTVNFQTTGRYYVWLRGAGGAANVGIDGVASTTGIAGFGAGWTWSSTTFAGWRAVLDVRSTGNHTISVWMWNDRLWLDKVLLVQDSGYYPSGTGPSESGSGGSTVTSAPSYSAPAYSAPSYSGGSNGTVSLVKFTSSAYDGYIYWPSSYLQSFQQQHLQRMVVFSPAFNPATSWYGNGLIYVDAYAAYVGGTTFNEAIQYTHPDWIMKDQWGSNLYIPFACYGGSCTQYAADFSNPGFRSWWVTKVRQLLSAGNYKGLYIDDVNMDWRVSDNWGNQVTPWDRNTNAPMTLDNWRRYMAEFMEFVKQNLSGYEICHNSIWFAGGDSGRDSNPYIHRQLMAADDVNIEYGINDNGLTGGTGTWSAEAVLQFAERLNGMGKHVMLSGIGSGDPNNRTMFEYGVAGYFLVNNGGDYSGDSFNMVIDPNYWWNGFDVNLGSSTGGRWNWNGLQRRDFTNGMVLLNYPGNPAISVDLGGTYYRLDGSAVSWISLQPKQAVILKR